MKRSTAMIAAMIAAALLAGPSFAAEMDQLILTTVSVERLEYRLQDRSDVGFVEGDLTIGNDTHKVVLGVEAERALREGVWEGAELHALYRTPVSDFFDLQAGIRHDFSPDPETTHLALGVAGLLPQWVEVDAKAYLSDEGDPSLRVEAEKDFRFSQRVFLRSLVELDVSGADVPERHLGAGFSKIEAGLRLHYEVERRFAPYIGVNHEAKLGETRDYARSDGEDGSATSFVAGISFFY